MEGEVGPVLGWALLASEVIVAFEVEEFVDGDQENEEEGKVGSHVVVALLDYGFELAHFGPESQVLDHLEPLEEN